MADLVTRNLTIVLTDIKGFTDKTSHKSRVEIQTLLDRHKEIVLPILEKRGGHLVKTMGDAFLATFESPTNAVLAGVEAQAALAAYNKGRKPDDRIEIRVAINQGEVNVADDDIFGEPVNITARIEAVADAGDVFFTEAIYLAMNKKEVPSSEVGLLQLKGIPEKVRVYRVKTEHPVENMGDPLKYAAERPAPEPEAAAAPAPSADAAPVPWAPLFFAISVAFACAASWMLYPRRPAPASTGPTPAAPAAPASPRARAASPIAARVANRTFPSIFMAWEHVSSPGYDPAARVAGLARYDFIFSGASTFGLYWRGSPLALSEEFTPDSAAKALELRRDLLARNPNIVLFLEIRLSSYANDDLPADHPWWLRDARGGRVPAFGKDNFQLDVHSPALQDHAAAQCRAALRTGGVDGCIFTAWNESDADDMALMKRVRAVVGEDALIMLGTGRALTLTAPLINGQYFAINSSDDPKIWAWNTQGIDWAQSHLRAPRLIGLSVTRPEFRPAEMRLATTLVLTHTDGYALFNGPARGGTDWTGAWPSFWNKTLGRPIGAGAPRGDGSTAREFEGGTAVYNPPTGKPTKSIFSETRTSAATGEKARAFTLPAGDGDLYLR